LLVEGLQSRSFSRSRCSPDQTVQKKRLGCLHRHFPFCHSIPNKDFCVLGSSSRPWPVGKQEKPQLPRYDDSTRAGLAGLRSIRFNEGMVDPPCNNDNEAQRVCNVCICFVIWDMCSTMIRSEQSHPGESRTAASQWLLRFQKPVTHVVPDLSVPLPHPPNIYSTQSATRGHVTIQPTTNPGPGDSYVRCMHIRRWLSKQIYLRFLLPSATQPATHHPQITPSFREIF